MPAATPARAVPAATPAPTAAQVHAQALQQQEMGAQQAAQACNTDAVAASMPLPVNMPDRVKGQMGTGTCKAERAKERAKILQQMEEDRSSYHDRRGASSAAAAQAGSIAGAQQAGRGSAGSATPVRLQLRCAASGRTVVTTAFTEGSALGILRDFAAAELGLEASGAEPPELQLAYPPRTTFSAPEQLAESLGALGLAPSATLLVRGAAQVAPAEAQVGSSDAAPRNCPNGHAMEGFAVREDMWCDMCQQGLPAGTAANECRECDYIECGDCSGRSGEGGSVPGGDGAARQDPV